MNKLLANLLFFSVVLLGCAGVQRDCSSSCASNLGGDWVLVQYRFDGTPINCYQLKDTPITNEPHSDGVYWQDEGGHLVHISGWVNRVQVSGGKYDEAAKTLGVDMKFCKNGVYANQAPPTQTILVKEVDVVISTDAGRRD